MSRPLRIRSAAVPPEQVHAWLEEHHRACAAGDERLVKRGTRRLISRVAAPAGGEWVAVKQYLSPGWGRRVRDACAGTPAARAAALGERLERLGYRLPALLALAEEPGFPSPRSSYRINRWEEAALRLRHWFRRAAPAGEAPDPALVRRLACAFAACLGRFHAHQLWMPDFLPVNILLEDPDAPEPILVDYDKTREGVRDWRRRLLNLGQLRRSLLHVATPELSAAIAETYLEQLPPAERPPAALIHRLLAETPPKPVQAYTDRFWREHRRELRPSSG